MRPLVIWLRRGVGAPLAVVLSGFVLTSLLTQPGWRLEYDWATRSTAASVLLVTPFIAAAAAFDTSRRFRPTLAALSHGSPRRSLHVVLPALAVSIWSITAYVLVWAVAAALVRRQSGVGITDWSVFPEVVLPLLAAGAVGSWVGLAVDRLVAAPLAALAVFAGTVLASPWGRGPFEAVTTFGTLTGVQWPTDRVVAVLAGTLLVGLGAVLAARELHRSRWRRRVVLGGCGVLVLVGTIAPAAVPWHEQVYVPSREATGCVGSSPSVCGPLSRLPLLEPVQASLAEAYERLQGTDFTRPTSFRVTRLDHYSDLHGAAPLDFDPALVRGARYDRDAVALILLRPHQCRELFDATGATSILDAQDRVRPWLDAVLSGAAPAQPVPSEVETSFRVVEDCAVMTRDLQ